MDSLQHRLKTYVENGTGEELAAVATHLETNGGWSVVGPSGRTVYRGQPDEFTALPSRVFSTTTDPEVARKDFAGKNGCVWTIRLLPGTPYIDVATVLGPSYTKPEEAEILVGPGVSIKSHRTTARPCAYQADFGPPPPVQRPSPKPAAVSRDELLRRYREDADEDLKEIMGDTPDDVTLESYVRPNETWSRGGRRLRTRKGRRARKATRRGRNGRS